MENKINFLKLKLKKTHKLKIRCDDKHRFKIQGNCYTLTREGALTK